MAIGGGGGAIARGVEAGRAFVRISGDNSDLKGVLGKSRRMVLGFSAMMGKAGGAMLALGGGAAAGGLFKVMDTLKDVGKMENAARALGMTSEGASKLFGMLAANGGDFKEDLEGIVQFSAKVNDALTGVGGATGDAAKLFAGLSVQAKDLVGIPLDEQFFRVLEAIRELPQEMQAGKLALMGGTDSMKKWLPLLSRSKEELQGMAEANKISAEDMGKAREATTAYAMVTSNLGTAWRNVAVALAPAITEISGKLVPGLKDAAGWVEANRGLVVGLAAALVGTAAAGAALLVLSMTITSLVTVVGALGAVLGVVFTPVGLGVAAIIGATAAILEFTKSATGSGGVAGVLGDIGQTFKDTFDGVKDALNAGEWETAFEIICAGLKIAWKSFLDSIWKSTQAMWEKLKKETSDLGSDAALARGKKAEDSSWFDFPAALWGEFNREVLGGEDKAARGPLDRGPSGKARLSGPDADLKAAVESNTKALEESKKAYDDAIAEIMKPSAELEELKKKFAEQLAAAKLKSFTRDTERMLDRWLFADMAGRGKGGAAATAAIAGATRGGFGGHNLAAQFGAGGSTGDKIEKNTRGADEKLGRIEDKIGMIGVD